MLARGVEILDVFIGWLFPYIYPILFKSSVINFDARAV